MKKWTVFGLTVMLLASVVSVAIGGTLTGESGVNELMGDVIEIRTWEDLYNMRYDLAGSYRLMNDLGPSDPGYDDYASEHANGGEGWLPVGTGPWWEPENRFTGSFDGQDYTITGLYINRPSTDYIGLFGYIDNVEIWNLGIVDATVSGNYYVGGLVGYNWHSTVENSYATGSVSSVGLVGGLVGSVYEGSVQQSFYDLETTGQSDTGKGEPKTTAEMKTQSTFTDADWDFAIPGAWAMAGYPHLQWEHTTGITTVEELQLMKLDLAEDYTLLNDIDASSTTLWNGGAGFEPIGTSTNMFTGSFDGNDHTISRLYIDRTTRDVGLFGYVDTSGELSNVKLADVDITSTGFGYVGPLAGYSWGSITNAHSSGTVVGQTRVGGLVGIHRGAYLTYSHSTCRVIATGTWNVGGLAGSNLGYISNSYATGDVTGDANCGGLVGNNEGGTIEDSYAWGDVTGTQRVGGLVGINTGAIDNGYSLGEPTGSTLVGGLVGWNDDGTVDNSFWDVETSGMDTSDGGEPKTTPEMMTQSTFTDEDWDFAIPGAWAMAGYPHLQWEHTTEITTLAELQLMKLDLAEGYTLLNDIDASETSIWNGGVGFAPVGISTNPFTGTLNGNGHEIRDLYINRPNELNVGLFGRVEGGTIENLKVTGSVSGNGWVGGLVGYSDAGPLTIQEVVMEVDVANVNTYTIERVGGLVGVVHNGNRIRNCTSHGSVNGPADTNMGGLVGRVHSPDVIVENSYSTGLVNGGVPGDNVGGLAGFKHADAQVISSYWDTVTSGQTVSDGGEGKTTAEMMTRSTFVGWDFDDIWHMDEGSTYPMFQWQPLPEGDFSIVELTATPESDGWNFVSFNVDPDEMSLVDILEHPQYGISGSYDSVMYYDGEAGEWFSYVPGRASRFNDVDSWNYTMGVWIQMNSDATLTVSGEVPVSTDITLYPGWNMLGLPSESAGNHDLPVEVTRIGYFDASDEYNLAYTDDVDTFVFAPGNGYWVYNGADHVVTWTVEY